MHGITPTPQSATARPRTPDTTPSRQNNRGAAMVVTERDRDLIAWTCRLRLMTIPLVHHHFFPDAATPEAASRRLATLARAGYIRKLARTTPGGRAIYAATAAGHRLVDSPLRVTTNASSCFEHTLTVADIALQLANQGYTVTTEAEILHAATQPDPTAASTTLSVAASTPGGTGTAAPRHQPWLLARTPGGKTVRQYPDLVIERGGRRTIVEIELTRKSPQRNTQRAAAQARAITAGRFHQVRYYVPATRRSIAHAITRAVTTAAARALSPLPPANPTTPAWLDIQTLPTPTWDTSTEPGAPGSPAQHKQERARTEAERAEHQPRTHAEATAAEQARHDHEHARQQRLSSPERAQFLADMRTSPHQPPRPPAATT